MGCLLPLVAIFVPRLVMFFILILTDWFGRAFETTLWPLLGWFVMPYTTLVYMATMLNNDHQLSGGWIVLLIVAVIADLGGQSNSTRRHNSY